MKRAKYVAAALALALCTGQSQKAEAWSEDTHQELARQSILYMLRSDNPSLRFVGTIMMKAGEGGKASPTGERSWRLAEEAENVDHYVDVTLKNKGMSTNGKVGALLHEFQGNNFTAYNHFMLYDEGGKDTSSWSHDLYRTRCEDLVYDAEKDEEAFFRRQPGQAKNDCSRCTDPFISLAPLDLEYVNISGKLFSCDDVYPGYGARMWMDMHDNFGGYSLALDESLGNQVSTNGSMPSDGELIRMAASNQDFVDFCNEKIDDVADGVGDHPWIDFIVTALVPAFGISSPTEVFKSAMRWGAKKWVAPLCPQVEGYWPSGPGWQNALDTYDLNSSSIKKSDFDKVSLYDIRWHPVDNLIGYGNKQEKKLLTLPSVAEGEDYTPTTPVDSNPTVVDGPGTGGGFGRGGLGFFFSRRAPSGHGSGMGWPGGGNGWQLPDTMTTEDEAPKKPTHIGNLKALGRVLHGMSDLAVPGHITGHLMGVEHLIVEKGANEFVHGFAEYTEETSETGAVQFSSDGIGGSYATFDGLIDPVEARNMINGAIRSQVDKMSMEKIAEEAARVTLETYKEELKMNSFLRMSNKDIASAPTKAEIKHISARLRRTFLTLGLVNNVVASVKSMKEHYAQYSATPWQEIIDQLSWTQKDASLVSQPGKGGREFPAPGFFDRVLPKVKEIYNLNVDHNYHEFQESAGCYVQSHVWGMRPEFVTAIDMGAKVTFAANNLGHPGDTIHLTGTFANDEMEKEYYKGDLSQSAGQSIELPPGATRDGFAIWCSGPDIYREGRDINGNAIALSCEIQSIDPVGALPCNMRERQIWSLDQRAEDMGNWTNNAMPDMPAGEKEGFQNIAGISVLAHTYDTSPEGLQDALDSSHGKVVKVLDPSPWGRASFVWTDDNGLSNVATVKKSGSIVTKRSFSPILLKSKRKP